MAHYYSEYQDSIPRRHPIDIRVGPVAFSIDSASGIFSARKLDRGTRALIDNCIAEDGWNILDLGCGYGPVGIALAKMYPEAKVMMSDVNRRAVKLAKENCKKLGLKNAQALHSDGFEAISRLFETILLNPPQRAGKEVCLKLIAGAKEHLKPGGLLQVVARKNKGGNIISGMMEESFGNVRPIAKEAGYWVYVSKNKS